MGMTPTSAYMPPTTPRSGADDELDRATYEEVHRLLTRALAPPQVPHDYLTPFLQEPIGVNDPPLQKEDAFQARDGCLKALKERLVERANIVQSRLDEVRFHSSSSRYRCEPPVSGSLAASPSANAQATYAQVRGVNRASIDSLLIKPVQRLTKCRSSSPSRSVGGSGRRSTGSESYRQRSSSLKKQITSW